MTKELHQALSVLCGMWSQYCQMPWGHEFMGAGEATADILDKYELLKNDNGYGGEVYWERLHELEPK